MATEQYDKDKVKDVRESDAVKSESIQPDPETLDTTDPQDQMKGPLSSLMQSTSEAFDNDKSEEEANKEADER